MLEIYLIYLFFFYIGFSVFLVSIIFFSRFGPCYCSIKFNATTLNQLNQFFITYKQQNRKKGKAHSIVNSCYLSGWGLHDWIMRTQLSNIIYSDLHIHWLTWNETNSPPRCYCHLLVLVSYKGRETILSWCLFQTCPGKHMREVSDTIYLFQDCQCYWSTECEIHTPAHVDLHKQRLIHLVAACAWD